MERVMGSTLCSKGFVLGGEIVEWHGNRGYIVLEGDGRPVQIDVRSPISAATLEFKNTIGWSLEHTIGDIYVNEHGDLCYDYVGDDHDIVLTAICSDMNSFDTKELRKRNRPVKSLGVVY